MFANSKRKIIITAGFSDGSTSVKDLVIGHSPNGTIGFMD